MGFLGIQNRSIAATSQQDFLLQSGTAQLGINVFFIKYRKSSQRPSLYLSKTTRLGGRKTNYPESCCEMNPKQA
jgi:hypothetical protein